MDDFWRRTGNDDDEVHNPFPYAPFPRPIPVPTAGIFDPPTLCLVINTQWAARFMGALDVLDQPDVWDTDPEGVIEARQQIREALRSWMTGEGCAMVDPCCPETNDLLIQINSNNQNLLIQQVLTRWQVNVAQNSQLAFDLRVLQGDSTDYHSYAPDAPDTGFSEDSSDSTEELQTAREAALCSAVDRYVEQACSDITVETNMAAGLIGTTVTTLASLVFWPIGLILGVATGVAAGLWNGAMNDPEGRRQVKCCMYDSLKGEAIDFAIFRESLADCGFDDGSAEAVIAAGIHQYNGSEACFRAFVNMLGGEMSTVAPGGVANQCDCNCGVPTVQIGSMINHGDSSYTLTSEDYTAEHATIYGNSERIGWPFLRWEVPGCCEIIMGQVIDAGTGGSLLGYWEECDATPHPDTPGVFYPPEGEAFSMALAYRAHPDSNHFTIKVILGGA